MSATLKAKILIPGNLPKLLWYSIPTDFEGLKRGQLAQVPLGSRKVIGLVWELETLNLDFKTKDILEIFNDSLVFSQQWMQMLEWVSIYYKSTLPISFKTILSDAVIKLLTSKPKANSPPPNPAPTQELATFELTDEQNEVLSQILPLMESVDSLAYKSFLLHGVTGSGKTFVYQKLVERCLDLGKNALILLPEIALAPMSVEYFRRHLKVPVFAYHSNLGAKQKRALWNALKDQSVRVIIGVRSAVFCPMENIGLIVVDEEHDGSYKQSEKAPFYNARDVALYRGRQFQCPVILGSATPALESYFAAQCQKHTLLQMHQRATQSPLPKIHVVDMKEQLELQGDAPLSIPLREALTHTLKIGEQAILLLNRRGYAKIRLNKTTGEPLRCPKCSVPLVPHKKNDSLICHHCGFAERGAFSRSDTLTVDLGLALEQLEEYLQKIFPQVNILRLDRDSIGRQGALEKILSDFDQGKGQILIGTQMVAKGHDFKNVNLVGVLDTDSGLALPDFRAQERMFQLITQVAGRAGRHSNRGRVYLQTFQPENRVIDLALKNDYQNFYRAEMELRDNLGYPPACKLVKIELSGKNESRVLSTLENYADILRGFAERVPLRILGPGQAAIPKINHQFRSQIFVKCNNSKQLQWVIEESLNPFSKKLDRHLKLIVDVDPLSVM